MKKVALSLITVFSLGSLLALPAVAHAATCGPVKTAINYGCKTNVDGVQINPILSLMLVFIDFLAIGAGIAAVAGIVTGAIIYIASNGNPKVAHTGLVYILNSIIGLLLFIFMYAIVNFLVPGGLFE